MSGWRALAFCLACAVNAVRADTGALGLVQLDEPVPGFVLGAAEGEARVDSAGLRGTLVLLHFWATWCAPCREELPALQTLAARFDDRRVRILLVAIDEERAADEVRAYARDLGVTLPVFLARAGEVPPAFWTWGVPVTYLIDADGRFIGRALGARPWALPTIGDAIGALAPAASGAPAATP